MAVDSSGYSTDSGGFFQQPPASSPLGDLAAALAAAAGAAGVGYNLASAAGGSGARNPRFYQAPGTAHFGALSRYASRLLAENATQMPPTFRDFLQSGGTATFPIQGANQFTPLEAVQLGLVPGSKKFNEVPYYTPGQGDLTPEQWLFLQHQRQNKNRANKLLSAQVSRGSGGGGSSNKPKVNFTVDANTGNING